MSDYIFEEQTDVTKRVRWGAYQPDDIEANMHLVKKGEKLFGEITAIAFQEFDTDKKDEEGNEIKRYAPNIMMKLEKDLEVRFVAPARLTTALGLNEKWKKTHMATEGDMVEIVYQGRSKEAKGNPHMFEVRFAKVK